MEVIATLVENNRRCDHVINSRIAKLPLMEPDQPSDQSGQKQRRPREKRSSSSSSSSGKILYAGWDFGVEVLLNLFLAVF